MTQNSLGLALMKLGSQQVGTERLKEAVAAFEAALEKWTGSQLPNERGAALHNLATSYSQMGERDSGTENLLKAKDTFALALDAVKDNPRMEAIVQNSLATNLIRLGEREKDTKSFKEAVRLASDAASTFSSELMPIGWVMAQTTVAYALKGLGEREGRAETLDDAANAFHMVLKVMTRKGAPLKWFNLQVSLGATLLRRAELDATDTAGLRNAVSALNAALDEPMRGRDPSGWASAQNALAVAFLRLGEREDNTAWLNESEKAFRNALEEWTQTEAPSQWATATNGLASVLAVLGGTEANDLRLQEAIEAFHAAEEEITRQKDPGAWAYARNGLAVALINRGILHETERASLEAAVTSLLPVLDEWTEEQSPKTFQPTRTNIHQALSILQSRGINYYP